jgi:hypothetical protein
MADTKMSSRFIGDRTSLCVPSGSRPGRPVENPLVALLCQHLPQARSAVGFQPRKGVGEFRQKAVEAGGARTRPQIAPKWRRSLLITGAALWAAPPFQADQEAAALRDSAIGSVDYLFKASLRAFAGVKVSFLEAAIFIASPVAGFRPSRAGDAFTLKSGREEVGR